MNLEEIAQREEFILFDTSISQLGDFPWNIFPFSEYSQLDTNEIINIQNKLLYLIGFINLKNIFTIKEVFEELSSLETILSDKGKNFNKIKREMLKRRIKTSDNHQEKEYNNLLKITHELILNIKKKIIKPDELIKYEIFYNSILDIKEKFLTPTNNILVSKEKEIKSNNLNTDEKLTAMLFYLSTVKYKSCALVSKDYGIFLLADKFYRVICAEKTYKCLKEMLIENPVRIYLPFKYSDTYELIFSSRDEYSPHQLYKEIKKIRELKKEGFKIIKF